MAGDRDQPGARQPASLWLREATGSAPDAPSLTGQDRAEVAIVGGGYVGLWTAIKIKRARPGCDVAVVEQSTCGSGASGRNGGFALTWWPKLSTLCHLFGESAALRLCDASDEAIDELERFCSEHEIAAAFHRGGFLWTATTPAQIGAWNDALLATERLGREVFVRLTPDEVARRSGSPAHLAGILEPRAATVHPGHLARGLRRVALSLGVRIFEHTRVEKLDRSRPAVLTTPSGMLTADRVVLATNAWAAGLRELRNRLVVVSSDIVATAPARDQLEAIGWTDGVAVSDSLLMVDYYRTTDSGRVVFGKGGWTIAFGGHLGSAFARNPRRLRQVADVMHRIYPSLEDVAITDGWSGPVDRPAMGLPLIGRLGGRPHIFYGVGWSGNGVAPSVVGGRILASLALDLKDEWSRSPIVDGVPGRFPPEPIRYLGGHIVRTAVAAKERAEVEGREPRPISRALARLAPGSFASGRPESG